MRPWEMERLTRFQAFELYLEPAKEDSDGQALNAGNTLSHREQAFWSLQSAGDDWLTAERKYQEWQNAAGRGTQSVRTASSGE